MFLYGLYLLHKSSALTDCHPAVKVKAVLVSR